MNRKLRKTLLSNPLAFLARRQGHGTFLAMERAWSFQSCGCSRRLNIGRKSLNSCVPFRTSRGPVKGALGAGSRRMTFCTTTSFITNSGKPRRLSSTMSGPTCTAGFWLPWSFPDRNRRSIFTIVPSPRVWS